MFYDMALSEETGHSYSKGILYPVSVREDISVDSLRKLDDLLLGLKAKGISIRSDRPAIPVSGKSDRYFLHPEDIVAYDVFQVPRKANEILSWLPVGVSTLSLFEALHIIEADPGIVDRIPRMILPGSPIGNRGNVAVIEIVDNKTGLRAQKYDHANGTTSLRIGSRTPWDAAPGFVLGLNPSSTSPA